MTSALPSLQQNLLEVLPDRLSETNASRRNLFGAFAAEFVCAATGFFPIPINGNCEICLDAEFSRYFLEIKSVRKNRQAVIYKWRMEKEKRSGLCVNYAFFVHEFAGEKNYTELLEICQNLPPKIYIIPLHKVQAVSCLEKLRKIDTAKLKNAQSWAGYAREGYKDGYYQVSVKKFVEETRLICNASFTFYNKPFTCQIYG